MPLRPNGNGQTSAIGELGLERIGDARRSRRDQDCVVGCAGGVSDAAVADQHVDVPVAERSEPLARLLGKHRVPLDRNHLARQLREDSRLIA